MELFHFDIECAGNYKDFKSFKLNDERGAKLFESRYNKMFINGIAKVKRIADKTNPSFPKTAPARAKNT